LPGQFLDEVTQDGQNSEVARNVVVAFQMTYRPTHYTAQVDA